MDIVLLPVLQRETSPVTALEKMKESRRSLAVVVGSPPQGLITSVEAHKAKNKKQTNLIEAQLETLEVLFDGEFISNGYQTLKLPDTSVGIVRQHLLQTYPGMAHQRLYVPSNDLPQFEKILPPGTTYGFLGYDRGAAVVMSAHESGVPGPPADCCCLNPDYPHEYQAGRKSPGQSCDLCAFAIEC